MKFFSQVYIMLAVVAAFSSGVTLAKGGISGGGDERPKGFGWGCMSDSPKSKPRASFGSQFDVSFPTVSYFDVNIYSYPFDGSSFAESLSGNVIAVNRPNMIYREGRFWFMYRSQVNLDYSKKGKNISKHRVIVTVLIDTEEREVAHPYKRKGVVSLTDPRDGVEKAFSVSCSIHGKD